MPVMVNFKSTAGRREEGEHEETMTEHTEEGNAEMAAWTEEQQATFVRDIVVRSHHILELLANACPSRSIRSRVCERLVSAGILSSSWRQLEAEVSPLHAGGDNLDSPLPADEDFHDARDSDLPAAAATDGDHIDPVDLLQIEVRLASLRV